jgi:hypothetical protein
VSSSCPSVQFPTRLLPKSTNTDSVSLSVSSDHDIDTRQSFSVVMHEDDEELDDLDINPLLG